MDETRWIFLCEKTELADESITNRRILIWTFRQLAAENSDTALAVEFKDAIEVESFGRNIRHLIVEIGNARDDDILVLLRHGRSLSLGVAVVVRRVALRPIPSWRVRLYY